MCSYLPLHGQYNRSIAVLKLLVFSDLLITDKSESCRSIKRTAREIIPGRSAVGTVQTWHPGRDSGLEKGNMALNVQISAVLAVEWELCAFDESPNFQTLTLVHN